MTRTTLLPAFALVLAPVLAGCGSGADPMQRFVGTWAFTSGTDDVSCPNGNSSEKLAGSITVDAQADGDLVVHDAAGCNFAYTVAGDTATVADRRSCSFPVPELGQGVTAAVDYDSLTLATSDGKTMTDSFAGKVAYTSSAGTLYCVFSGRATLDKQTGG